MLRLLLLLLGAMYLTWQVGGADRGQQRPAMAQALALGKPVILLDADSLADLATEAAAPALTPPLHMRKTEPPPLVTAQPAANSAQAALDAAAPPAPKEAIFTLSALTEPQLPARPLEPQNALDPALYANDGARVDAQSPTFRLNANSVNLRTGPSTSQSVITLVGPSDRLRVLDSPAQGWVEVEVLDSGARGFLAAKFLIAAES